MAQHPILDAIDALAAQTRQAADGVQALYVLAHQILPPEPFLLGSGTLSSLIDVNGKAIQLGDLVRQAHTDSKMTVAAWNDQDETARDAKLLAKLGELRTAAKAKK